ncbi:MAG: hypothetical protein CVU42_13615 [Chloroflexi bacterium HGW-Chloroflexi-4]|jgi:hypothetical protein|nr:MAG: hypothetical protein CVU42_13615 [Chloroflexi bacterium HGW-Chloroflexi-4]
MKLVWKSFSLCKEGNREEENEDAVYPQLVNGSSLVADHFSCAMADGATSSSFSKLWANLLVKESSQSHNLSTDFNQTINAARASWKAALPDQDLPWPTAIKVRQGAFSTLMSFQIWQKNGNYLPSAPPPDHGWMASAVGDTCLFLVVKGKFVSTFPFTQAKEFSNTPELVSTNLAYTRTMAGSISGKWQRGDHFLIATDALSEWMIRNLESGSLTWPLVSENLTSLVRYQTWIRYLRRQALIKNDDTSLICLTVDD